MVVFTCNHCGESLRKQGIEKHYTFVCRNAVSVTCVDCFKDFKEEDYVSHIKCITEEERYAAKGSMPNGVVKKGELKQESWVDMIKSILEDAKLNSPQRDLLTTISSYNNIPRKKPKFLNFIRSSSGGRINMKVVEDVWNIIESYKTNNQKQQQDSNKRKSSEDILNDDNDTHQQKKKKKIEEHGELKKNLVDQSNNVSSISNTDINQPKKKKKHQDIENGKLHNEEIKKKGKDDSNNINEISNIEEHQQKKKKKKNKHQNQEMSLVESQIEEIKTRGEIGNMMDDSNNISDINNIDVNQSKMKKKKNKHKEQEIDSEESQKGKNETVSEPSTEPTEKFDFQAQIIKIIENKTTIPLKKLQKKVINAYLQQSGEAEANSKVIKRFNRSLKKIYNVEIVDENVSLKSN